MDWNSIFIEHWPVKLVSVILIVAAWIDGKQLKVPNWITYPMVLTGLIYCGWTGGWEGLGAGLIGMCVGLATLLPLYAVGGMGAGDVKLMAGIGAWLGATVTWNAFLVSVVVGGVMAAIMVVRRRSWERFYGNSVMILNEFMTVKDPRKLADAAAERKPRMHLLPYGIPICIGSIGYFLYAGMM